MIKILNSFYEVNKALIPKHDITIRKILRNKKDNRT